MANGSKGLYGWSGKRSRKNLMNAKTIQKYKKLSTPKLKLKAQAVFNKWIRERDQDEYGMFECISCGKRSRVTGNGNNYQAGHFYSAGHHTLLRFNEDNVHGQDKRCNYFLSGNLTNYERNLIKKIGKERVQALHDTAAAGKRFLKKWDRFELIEIIEKYGTDKKG